MTEICLVRKLTCASQVIAFQLDSMSHRPALAGCDFLRLQYYGCCSKSLPFRAIAPRAAAGSDCSLDKHIVSRSVRQMTNARNRGQSHGFVYCIRLSISVPSTNLRTCIVISLP